MTTNATVVSSDVPPLRSPCFSYPYSLFFLFHPCSPHADGSAFLLSIYPSPPLLAEKSPGPFSETIMEASASRPKRSRIRAFLLLELGILTSTLVKKMSTGLVRIALECRNSRTPPQNRQLLLREPVWTMYCNGRNCGKALSRACSESDWHILRVRRVSVGAGVIPVVEDVQKTGGVGASEVELLYMRARFERVVGTRDSEAFYMLNLDGNGARVRT